VSFPKNALKTYVFIAITCRLAPKKNNVFGLNSPALLNSVASWLLKQKDLNLTAYESAAVKDNYIWLIEVLPAPKSKALAYMAGTEGEPWKFAKAVIYAGKEKVVKELKVGPLPISSKTTYSNMDAYGKKVTVPFNSRYVDSIEYVKIF
jgi:hypothetical protein